GANPNMAAMIGDDRAHDRQAQSRPVFLRREIWLEDPRSDFRRESRAVVGNLEQHRAAGRRVRGCEADFAALLDRGDGIVDEIDQHALDLVTVELKLRDVSLAELEADALVSFFEEKQ